ncbi:hypothetical protein HBA54_13070 [Pelagibius litoralis]|uniref:Uncharacterized protein n=1 Tax=Pelagibius litoralis TaxID=374515 RepID=A0A967KFD6_9PROT|nr:hypothetical protein [Pelagibius litoralis]NIA69526.1 hypothetical protein [Pelagibius litoralis]
MRQRGNNRQRAKARAITAEAQRQRLLLGVVVTILAILALFMWSHQARAALGDATAATAGTIQAVERSTNPREVLVGRWYGEQQRAGGTMKRWVVEAFPDGVFRITFRFYEADGNYSDQIEVGEWAISGPVYFLSTKGWIEGETFLKADTSSADLYDAYRIIKLGPKLFEYEHFVNGSRYQVRRVNASFTLPE